MLKSYFKTAWRNLVKNKFYSIINIAGLTAGLTVGILILLWVQDELSFDRFHQQSGHIYKLENEVGTGSSRQIWTATTAPIGKMVKEELPEVEEAVRIDNNGIFTLFTYKEKVLEERATAFTDPAMFSMFDFPLIRGNAANPFPSPYSVVMTASAAKRYFGEENPLGKVIVANDKTNFTVTGVVNDLPANSSIRFDMFLPMELQVKLRRDKNPQDDMEHDFHQFDYDTYLLVKSDATLKALPARIRQIHLRNKPDDGDIAYLLHPLKNVHLYDAKGTERGMETVRMFMIVALLILIIACINYVNLSTARSLLRAREVVMRKIVGAGRAQLFLQFVVETTLLFLIATVLSLGTIQLLMPVFNELSGKNIVLDPRNGQLWLLLMLTIVGTLVASSIYPALLLSSFEPIKALKGKIGPRINDTLFRKVLVVTQFACSVALIIGTLIISRQLNFIRTKQLGYDKEHVFAVRMRSFGDQYDALKARILQQPGISQVARADDNIVDLGRQTGNNDWDGKEPNQTFMLYTLSATESLIPLFNMQMAAGKNFTGTVADSMHFILNETAIKQLGIKDPVGKRFKLWNTEGTILGIVKDFHFASMRSKIQPVVLHYKLQYANILYAKATGNNLEQTIAAVEKIWKEANTGYPFSYFFLDESFDFLYRAEQRTSDLFRIFAGIAIFISCLGLFGLATFTAQVRTREIGIRKVLGASVPGIIRLLAKDFIKLVLLAIVIALPLAWFAMNKWLQDFQYKVKIGWMVFVVAALLVIIIAVLTISVQAVKAALTSPVKNLRTE